MSPTTVVTPPGLGMLAIEPFRALLEFAQAQYFHYQNHAQGDGHAVVLFPGLGADHTYMAALASHCERLGHACLHWGRGRNTGPSSPSAGWLAELASDIEELVDEHPARVTFIGWSLGGIYAREVAKAIPERVRQVITLGTPCANLGESTNAGWFCELLSGGAASVDRELDAKLGTPPPVHTTSIYSRSDGVVAWQACRLTPGLLAENIEVDSSHLGLIWHPDVLRAIGWRLRTHAS